MVPSGLIPLASAIITTVRQILTIYDATARYERKRNVSVRRVDTEFSVLPVTSALQVYLVVTETIGTNVPVARVGTYGTCRIICSNDTRLYNTLLGPQLDRPRPNL